MKKVAIQFSGLVRGFRFKKVRDLIYERIIERLKNQGFEVHTFWHVYDVEFDDIIYNLDDKFNAKKVVVEDHFKIQDFLENEYKLLEKFQFENWNQAGIDSTELISKHGGHTCKKCVGHPAPKDHHKYGWFKVQRSYRKSTELRNNYEKEKNIEYDWVILTEPQCVPSRPMDDLNELDGNSMYCPSQSHGAPSGYFDGFWLGTPEHINYLSKLYDYLINFEFKNDNSGIETFVDAEPIKAKYIDKKFHMSATLKVYIDKYRYVRGWVGGEYNEK